MLRICLRRRFSRDSNRCSCAGRGALSRLTCFATSSCAYLGRDTMVTRVFKIRVSSAIMAVVLVTGITVAGAVTASPAGAATAGSALAPCTTPLFGADKDCESTSPTVDRWVTFQSGAQSCTYTQFVDWGDGTSSSRTFVDPIPALYFIASHKYGPESRTTTYTETVTSSVDSGNCKAIATTVFKF